MKPAAPPAAPTEPVSPAVGPPPGLPAPTGDHAVGIRFLAVEAAEEGEPNRRVLLRIWYPAREAKGSPEVYERRQDGTVAAVSLVLGVDAATLMPLIDLPTHARRDASAADGRFPVLLFSPGYVGPTTQNTALAEELASRGVIVAVLGHPGETLAARTPEGGVVPPDMGRVGAFLEEAGQAAELFQRASAAVDAGERVRLLEEFAAASPIAAARAATWVRDSERVAAVLASWDQADPVLAGHVDTSRVLVGGMSFGGGVAAAACARIAACLGSFDLDGLAPLPADQRIPHKPHLLVIGDDAPSVTEEALGAAAPVWRLHVVGAQHLDHTDMPLLVRGLPLLGDIGGVRMHSILVRAVDALIDRVALGGDADPGATNESAVTVSRSPAAR